MSGEFDRVAVLGREVGERWGALDPIWPDGPAAAAWLPGGGRGGGPGGGAGGGGGRGGGRGGVARGEHRSASEFAAEAIRFGATSAPDELLAAMESVEGALARARAALVRGT